MAYMPAKITIDFRKICSKTICVCAACSHNVTCYSTAMTNAESHLHGLNTEQQRAVNTTEGPVMVLAGAGSGKTRVITHRIVHLITQGVDPSHILAITFTNKAANEMRERVAALLSKYHLNQSADSGAPTTATFHALCVRILREFYEHVGIRKHFTIYDRSDSLRAIKAALKAADYDPKQFEPKKILAIISRAKGDAVTRADFTTDASRFTEQVAARVWEEYETILKREQALDFDDLLLETYLLLQRAPAVRAQLQDRYQYIHIDEYQDTNAVQYKIAQLLTGAGTNICVVGDIDQNVYSWRGADIQNLLQFERHYHGAQTIILEENYRSTQTIIAASNDVIKQNNERIDKTVFTNNKEGEPITLYAAMSGTDEAEYIVMKVRQLIEDGYRPRDIAVLFRTNFQSRALEEAFLNYSVPYQVVGTKFFERKEVKDVLSFLRLAVNPESYADLARIANVPPRGLGKVTVLKLVEGRRDDITGAAAKKVAAFNELMMDISVKAREAPISETINFIMKRSGLSAHYTKEGTEEDLARLENMRELVTLAQRYDALGAEEGVAHLLEDAALQSDQDELGRNEDADAVRLMTVHAAKGLEFPHVFIAGLEEGLFPHERLDDGRIDHEEERRLFYVALTRAEEQVHLSYAHVRMIFGSQRINVPSSFLDEIDEAYLEAVGPHQPSEREYTIDID